MKFYVLLMEDCQDISHILWGWAVNVPDCSQRVSSHERVEVVDSAVFSQLVVKFEACLKKVSKQLKLLRFLLSNVGIVVVSDFGNLEI